MINLSKIRDEQEKNFFFKWVNHYQNPLSIMFDLFKENEFKDYNDNDVIKDIKFIDFSYFVYVNSSKYLANHV